MKKVINQPTWILKVFVKPFEILVKSFEIFWNLEILKSDAHSNFK